MDIKELFGGDTVARIKYRGVLLENHLRAATHEEDLEYRRRTAKAKMRSGHIETSDTALQAPIWLYDKLCHRVVMHNGTGVAQELTGDEIKQVSPRVKLEAINIYMSEVEREEDETLKN